MGAPLNASFLSEIKLGEIIDVTNPRDLARVQPQVQILRVGKFAHPTYGEFEITKAMLAELKTNFDNRVRGIDVAIDYSHENEGTAAGWIKQLTLLNEGTELWATEVDWTPRARKLLSDREYRYFSPEFNREWTNPETKEIHRNVLFGGGLTNRPFVKEMTPVVSLEEKLNQEKNKGAYKMDEKDKKIAELEAKVAELMKQIEGAKSSGAGMAAKFDEVTAEVAKLTEANALLVAEKATLEEAKKLSEKEAAFTVLLTEGKACAAQKEAFIKGDMQEFVAKAQPINLAEKGNGKGTETSGGDVTDKVMKLAEEKRKANAALDVGASISLVLKENPELSKARA